MAEVLLQGTTETMTQCDAYSWVSYSYRDEIAWDGIKDGEGGYANCWRSNIVPTGSDFYDWIEWNFPNPKLLTQFRFQARSIVTDTAWPSAGKWYGKTTAQSWEEATLLFDDAFTGAELMDAGDWLPWNSFTTTGLFDSYRLIMDASYAIGTSGGQPEVQEFEFYEDDLEFEVYDLGSSTGVTSPTVASVPTLLADDISSATGISFPFGDPYVINDPSKIVALLTLKAFNLQSVFGINSVFRLSAFSIESVIQKVIDIRATQALKSFRLEAEVFNERQVTANLQIGKLSINAVMGKDQLIQGALRLGALNLSSVVAHISTAEGNFTLSPFELKAKGLKPLDYVVLRFER